MPKLTPILTADQIQAVVKSLAERITKDFQGREVVLVGVLKGSFIFLSDLARQLRVPVKIDFVQARSYGSGTDSCGIVRLVKDIDLDIRGRDVLLVEDIVDTGLTLQCLLSHLSAMGPRSLGVCALIDKRERRRTEVAVAYAGHVTDEGFLVGYGLDHAEDYRELPGIFHLDPEE
jgi:hypoxanthine phosphoribosyltransferase